MSFFFGGRGSKVKPQFTGLAIQTSASTLPVTLMFGKNRVAPNIFWQGDFQAHKQKQKAGKGMGGSSTTYTYSGSYMIGLCFGIINGVTRVWKDQSKETSYAALGWSLFTGTAPQAPWGYMTTAHPSEALGYPHIAYLAAANYDLGQSNALQQHSFEVEGPLWDTQVDGTGDADPAQIVDAFLTDDIYGAGFNTSVVNQDTLMSGPNATTTGDAAFQTYCRAMGFGLSPVLSSQEAAGEILDRWTKLCNTALVWTGYDLRFIPYESQEITDHGVTYLPDVAVRYSLTDADFIYNEGEDPIRLRRVDPWDAYNSVKLEVRDRDNEYNGVPAEWRDQGLIDQFGMRPLDSMTALEVCDPNMGATMAALWGQRTAYIRNFYFFRLGPQYCRLTAMDILELYDPRWGTFYGRVIRVEENEDDQLEVECEEYAGTISSTPGAVSTPVVSNNPVNQSVAPGPVNPPILIQPPPQLTDYAPQVWAAVSGGDGTNDNPNWGGCEVWISTDGGTSYQMVGTIDAPARMGVLTSGLAAYGGANPDTVNTLAISSAMSNAEFTDATAVDAEAGVTLTYIAPEGANVEEFLTYTTATLTGTNAYSLDDLWRGLYGSTPGAHATGAKFARLDTEAVFKYDFPIELIGETIYVKFVSFNIFGLAKEDIASVTAYTITLSSAYTYGIGLSDLNDVTGTPVDGQVVQYTGSGNYSPTSQPYGFGFQKDISGIAVSKPFANFDTPAAWTLPQNLPDCQATIGDSGTDTATAPSAQTDFDIQVGGASVGTMRFAASSLTATFIMASDTSVALGVVTKIVAPSNLNGMAGCLFGTIKGKRP